jgi:hypothetical protein
LKLRFQHGEIYVREYRRTRTAGLRRARTRTTANSVIPDLYRTCAGLCQPIPRLLVVSARSQNSDKVINMQSHSGHLHR